MANTDDEEEPTLSAHVGKATLSAGLEKGRFPNKKKSTHLVDAEKAVLNKNSPKALYQLTCKPLNQEARIRSTKEVSDMNLSRGYIVEAILLQSRADVCYKGEEACSNCQDSNGYFKTCRALQGYRAGICGNCLGSGEGYKRCSFVPDDVKKQHKRKSDGAGNEGLFKKQKTGKSTRTGPKIENMDRAEVFRKAADSFTIAADSFALLAHLSDRLADLDIDRALVLHVEESPII